MLAAAGASSQDRPQRSALEIMEQMTVPASDAIFNITDPPATNAAWAAAGAHATTLRESAVLLKADRSRPDDAGWQKEVQVYLDAAEGAIKAIERKNFEALTAASDQLGETCVTCHEKFLNKK